MRWLVLTGTCAALVVAGCAGVDVRPITARQAESAHEAGRDVRGYIVYAPLVVVEVSRQEGCIGKDDKGHCVPGVQCVAGKPFLLPDYSRPYLIDAHAGLGRAGLDVTIADGWRLGSLKDSSDNGDLLGALDKIMTRSGTAGARSTDGECRAAGLYRVSTGPDGLELSKLLVY